MAVAGERGVATASGVDRQEAHGRSGVVQISGIDDFVGGGVTWIGGVISSDLAVVAAGGEVVIRPLDEVIAPGDQFMPSG